MTTGVGRRVALAVNPTAGRGRAAAAAAAALPVLRSAGLDVVDVRGGSGDEAAALMAASVAEGVEALVVVGGDGMVNLGINAVAGTAVPLGIVPAGTGNDFARGLDLPVGDAPAAARVAAAALADEPGYGVRRVDAVRVTADGHPDRWFGGVLGAGFDALVNERANGWKRPKGRLRYDLAILRELPVFRPRRYRLDLDGQAEEVTAMLVAVANGPAYGGGMRVCPDARMDDGVLDVLVVGPLSRSRFVRLYPTVYSGSHVSHEAVRILRARRVGVSSAGIVAYADGERFMPVPITCEAVPSALRVLAPTRSG